MGGGQKNFGQIKLFFLIKKIADIPELARLDFQHFAKFGIAVPETLNGNAGQEINIFLAVHIPKPGTGSTRNGNRIAAIGATKKFLFSTFYFFKCFRHFCSSMNESD